MAKSSSIFINGHTRDNVFLKRFSLSDVLINVCVTRVQLRNLPWTQNNPRAYGHMEGTILVFAQLKKGGNDVIRVLYGQFIFGFYTFKKWV